MADVDKILESKAIVRFSDCDPFNHLNNSKYIDYFLNAREDQLHTYYNFNVYHYAKKTGFGWVVGQNTIAYIKPALTMEIVLIESLVLHWGERDILVEFRMWDEEKIKLKACMWTKFYYINLTTQKSDNHSQALTDKFKPVEVHVEGMESFEKRIEVLRRK